MALEVVGAIREQAVWALRAARCAGFGDVAARQVYFPGLRDETVFDAHGRLPPNYDAANLVVGEWSVILGGDQDGWFLDAQLLGGISGAVANLLDDRLPSVRWTRNA